MKKKSATKAAFFTVRSLLGLLLCCASVLLVLFALGASPRFDQANAQQLGNSERSQSWIGRLASVFVRSDQAYQQKLHNKYRRGSARMSSDGTGAPGRRAKGDGAAQVVDPAVAKTITEHLNELGQTVYSISASAFDVSPPLRQLASMAAPQGVEEEEEVEVMPLPAWRVPRSDEPDPVVQVAPSGDDQPIKLRLNAPAPAAPTTGFNFAGVGGNGATPPDTNGSVGNNQYVETVNTRYQVWSLNHATNVATSVLGPSNISTLWSGFVGGNCSTRNDGDPIVLYDKLADRWLISQFTSARSGGTYWQCVAISQTNNAAGSYYRFAFAVAIGPAGSGYFGDYPKFGVWPDAYYVMAHAFTSTTGSYVAGVFSAMDRTKMLVGDSSATWQIILDPTEGGHVPADLDGFTPPPGGAPGMFMSLHGTGMYLYRLKVDFATPANTMRTLQAIIPIAPATAACGGGTCIPQPGTSTQLDSLADRLMVRLAYRNFVDHESLVVSHSVDPGVTGVASGVRWYDFRISGTPDAVCPSYPCTYQQGTIADVANGRSRWMPSIAMDGAENILTGYSVSGKTSGSENHTIRYTGRAKTDPLGTMTGPEVTVATGTRNETGASRWGDYTSTSIDPFDDCTFWHANEHYTTGTGAGTWMTRVASARFPAGSGAGQCAAATCTTRPTSAPTIGTASAIANNQIQITWTGISPTPGSYAIERALGPVGSEGLYQPLASVPGGTTSYVDTTVQGGLTYSYRVLAATDSNGKCQALVRSGSASATATGDCNLKPVFGGAASATSGGASICSITLDWTPAMSSCPLTPNIRYNIFRSTSPNFVPSPANRIATCAPGPSSYVDSANLTNGTIYYYIVRAEDSGSGHGGECNGGNEELNSIAVSGAAYGSGYQATPSTWMDAGGDGTGALQLNAGNPGNVIWRFVNTANDAGANHTPGGMSAYRNAGPNASNTYADSACAIAQTPVLKVGVTALNLTYWERHQLEKGWDGVAVEFSRNGGAWTSMAAPSNSAANGCVASDITTDWATISCSVPGNACGYTASTSMFTGPTGSGTSCTNWVTGALTAYGHRCHRVAGLTVGDTIQFRWRFTSDSAANFAGFYLDDIAVTGILFPNICVPAPARPVTISVKTVPAGLSYMVDGVTYRYRQDVLMGLRLRAYPEHQLAAEPRRHQLHLAELERRRGHIAHGDSNDAHRLHRNIQGPITSL